jgi:uncharacterized membrane protein YuzA (DUF378 family)
MKVVTVVALILVIVGALNWGLVGAFKFNLVQALFGDSALAALVYILVGVSGVVLAIRAASMSAQLTHAGTR